VRIYCGANVVGMWGYQNGPNLNPFSSGWYHKTFDKIVEKIGQKIGENMDKQES